MGEIVNLRRARKERGRREKAQAARANRVEFGRTKAECDLTDARKRLDDAKLDAHRREGADKP
ncbi:MAG: DUF4169 family protein [Methylocystis sp.]|nr:DUF4169 family protein [Methylocystis sp.]